MNNEEQRQIITPVCFALASTIFVALLVHDAMELESGQVRSTTRYTSARNAVVGAGIRALAEMLGLTGSIVVGAVVVAVMAAWVAFSYRRIRVARRA